MDITVFRKRSVEYNGLDRRDVDVLLAELDRLQSRLAEYKQSLQLYIRRETDLKDARDRAEAKNVELFGETERLKAALQLYADKTRWSRAWGDDEPLLYNIRENGADGWSIAQEALADKR